LGFQEKINPVASSDIRIHAVLQPKVNQARN